MTTKKLQIPKVDFVDFEFKSYSKALLIVGIDSALYLGSFVALVYSVSIPARFVSSIFYGIFSTLLFGIGHDACHQSFTSSKRFNEVVGRLAFLPTFFPFSLWDLGHNRIHHVYTNLQTRDYPFCPLSLYQYQNLSRLRRLQYRIYRSSLGIAVHADIEIWLRRMVVARSTDIGKQEPIYFLDRFIVVAYAFVVFILGYYTLGSIWETFLFLFLIPRIVFAWLFAWLTYQHHTHPNVPWFATFAEWAMNRDRILTTPYIRYSRLSSIFLHNIMEHTAHHLQMNIPLYELAKAQRRVGEIYSKHLIVEQATLGNFLRKIRICKLYDYENHQWLDLKGKVTSKVLTILFFLGLCGWANAQGLNYPGNSPIMDTGAGNARTDADNLFTRNNIAGLTEIADEADQSAGGNLRRHKWRILAEVQGTIYRYQRTFRPFGFSNKVDSRGNVGVPNFSGEATFTSRNRRFGFGIGISQVFGFESKLKDSVLELGSQAQFFDTKVASHDITFASAVRPHKKLSLGGSIIFGRAFLFQIGTIPQLASLGIIRQSRVDVSQFGGVGFSVGANWRPITNISIGANYKSQRDNSLKGSLDSFQPVMTSSGLQLLAIKLPVRVPFRFPAVLETGIKIKPMNRLTIAFDTRFYYYRQALDKVNILDQTTGTTIASLPVNAKNVWLFLLGGFFDLDANHKVHFGTGFVTNGIPDPTFNTGLMNTGGRSLTGGMSKKISGAWWIASLTGYFGLPRTIAATANPVFDGLYRNHGFTVGLGIRK